MDTAVRIDLARCIDDRPLGRFQTGVIALCALTLIMDGFDVQAMGYVAPSIIQEWGVPNSVLGPVFSAALVGVLIGSLLFSMLADRIGRRPVLIGATFYFALMTLVTARASSVEQLLVIRFVAGIGLGGIMPQAMALAGEYSPRRLRAPVMALIQGGFTAGAAFGGFIAAGIIPAFGWPAVFYFGGAVPLALGVAMIFLLPESLQFLVLKGKRPERVRAWVARIDPDAPTGPETTYFVQETRRTGVPAVHLFREGRTTTTLLLWVVNFMNLLDLYFLSSWLPTVVRDLGYSTRTAVLVGTSVQVGGVLGTIVISWWITRVGFKALAAYLAVGWLAVALIGQPGLSLPLLFAVVVVAGWCIIGGQPAVGALAGVYYPTDLRSTGIGWGLGIGRIGAIVGPVVGGQLMALRWTTREIFLAAAVPAFISMVVVVTLYRLMKPRAATG
jgi:AAHS family 4-hydroxybenzoate transporter-like MFS transporter